MESFLQERIVPQVGMSIAVLTYDTRGADLPAFYREKVGFTFFIAWLMIQPIILVGTFFWLTAFPFWAISWTLEYF